MNLDCTRGLISRRDTEINTHVKTSLFALPFQVVDLLNQAALIPTDEKLTVLKQVCSVKLFNQFFTQVNKEVLLLLIWSQCVLGCDPTV